MSASVAGAVEVEARAPRALARTHSLRVRIVALSLAADLGALLVSYALAMLVFGWYHGSERQLFTEAFDWGLPISVLTIGLTFNALGLYKLEAYVSRPLHFMIIVRATLVALVITAFVSFALKAQLVSGSRLTVFTTFALFFLLSSLLRLRFADRAYVRDVRAHPGATVVVGWSGDGGILLSRLKELRGFAQVRTLEPKDRRRNGYDAEPRLLEMLRPAEPAPRQVILESDSLGHKATVDLMRAAWARGADVYVTGRLVSPLDTTHLLMHLFEVPAMRVRRDPGQPPRRCCRIAIRAFDVLASGAALLLLAPAFAVIAVAVKRSSPGPVFYRQERVGKGGRTFQFPKFRSMTAGNDSSEHKECLQRFIGGELSGAMAQTDEWGRPVYKMAADPRVTRVGGFLRRYSLDELPQFWSVLRGDMSVVGPRPALPYEVEAYKQWHRLRLEVTPGVSGLWQIAGRSRVDFDDMVFQDIMYGVNQSLLTDVHICLRTVPAMLTGAGAA